MIHPRTAMLCGLTAIAASCSTTSNVTLKSEYVMAMESLRTEVTSEGIPRKKVFYQFQLDGMSSTRHGAGSVRGGWTSAWEEWSLPQGFRLIASKSIYVGRDSQITPLKEGESFFAPGLRLRVKEEYYREAPLEPYFDSIRLLDKKDSLIAEINLPRNTPAEQAAGGKRR
jgi:hypothetical protein